MKPRTFPAHIRACGLLIVFLLSVSEAYSQESRGSISGRVTDQSGAAVPQVSVIAENQATMTRTKTTSDSTGNYSIPFLQPGQYIIRAIAAGFKESISQPIEVLVDQRVSYDFQLEVGKASDSVVVTGTAPLLSTNDTSLGQTMSNQQLVDLPNAYGSSYQLLNLGAGINFFQGNSSTQYVTQDNIAVYTQFVSVNGSPFGTLEYTIDGAPNMQWVNGTSGINQGSGAAISVPADIVQEFRVESSYDASSGHNSGAVANAVMKTGSNAIHGSGYFYKRDASLNANSFFGNLAGQAKAPFTFNHEGGTFLGPVYLPKVYNGHNRTFFSFAYDKDLITPATSLTTTIPTPAEIKGDFSALLALGSQYQIYNPFSIVSAGNGRYSRSPVPGNIIPPSLISPIAENILSYYPAPNQPGTTGGVNNYSVNNRAYPSRYQSYNFRVDHNFSDSSRIYFRGALAPRSNGPYRQYWDGDATGEVYASSAKEAVLDFVHTVSPTLVLDFRYGYTRYPGAHNPLLLGVNPTSLGFSPAVASVLTQAGLDMFPNISISGLQSLGTESVDRDKANIHVFFASATKQLQAHTLKFGIDYRIYQEDYFSAGSAGGSFTFSTTYTQGPLDNSPSSPSGLGQGLAALLYGIPSSGSVTLNSSSATQEKYAGIYVHDNWRVNARLTLDLGLRWEVYAPPTERYNRVTNGFDPTAVNSVSAAAQAAYAANPAAGIPASMFTALGGLEYAGVGGRTRGYWAGSAGVPGPRFGYAYHVSKRIVSRGGFGLYSFDPGIPNQNRPNQTGYSQSTSMVVSLNSGVTYAGTLANPFPTGLIAASGSSLGVNTYLGSGFSYYDPKMKTPYTMHWSQTFQVQLPYQFLLETGYAGSKTDKLQIARLINALPDQYLSTSPVRDATTINYLTASVANPFAGLIPGTGSNGTTATRSQLLLPYPEFGSISENTNQGFSWYHNLTVRAERRFSIYATQFSYTFSKQMDAVMYLNPGDPRPYRSLSANDSPNRFSLSFLAQLPFGHDRKWLSSSPRFVNGVLGGWNASAVWLAYSGNPILWGDVLLSGPASAIPLPSGQQTIQHWFNTSDFVTNSALQLADNLRTFPLYLSSVRTGFYNDWDTSLSKSFPIHERLKVEFRADATNVFNHPSGWNAPNVSPTSSAFGQVTANYSAPRAVQLSIRGTF